MTLFFTVETDLLQTGCSRSPFVVEAVPAVQIWEVSKVEQLRLYISGLFASNSQEGCQKTGESTVVTGKIKPSFANDKIHELKQVTPEFLY